TTAPPTRTCHSSVIGSSHVIGRSRSAPLRGISTSRPTVSRSRRDEVIGAPQSARSGVMGGDASLVGCGAFLLACPYVDPGHRVDGHAHRRFGVAFDADLTLRVSAARVAVAGDLPGDRDRFDTGA